jgi:hypothetical protein
MFEPAVRRKCCDVFDVGLGELLEREVKRWGRE